MGLALQTAARRDLVDVAVNVDLQQRARMIGWTSGRFWNHTVKAQRPEIQLIDKHVDHPHRAVLSNVVIQIHGKQNALPTVFTLDETRHLTPPTQIIQNYNSTGVFTHGVIPGLSHTQARGISSSRIDEATSWGLAIKEGRNGAVCRTGCLTEDDSDLHR